MVAILQGQQKKHETQKREYRKRGYSCPRLRGPNRFQTSLLYVNVPQKL